MWPVVDRQYTVVCCMPTWSSRRSLGPTHEGSALLPPTGWVPPGVRVGCAALYSFLRVWVWGGGDGEGLPSVSKLGEVPNSFPQRILLSSLLELTGGSREWGVGRLRHKNSASSSSGFHYKRDKSKLARCLGALVGKSVCVGRSEGYT